MQFTYNVLKSSAEVQEAVTTVAAQILEDFPPDPDIPLEQRPLFIAFLKGANFFTTDLMRALEDQSPGYNPQIDMMYVSAYGDNETPSEELEIKLDLDKKRTVSNRPVIIVEDLLDTGTTIDFVRTHLRKRGATMIKVAVLAEKVQPRTKDVEADYKHLDFDFDPDIWLAGMGMDHAVAGPDATRARREILEVIK